MTAPAPLQPSSSPTSVAAGAATDQNETKSQQQQQQQHHHKQPQHSTLGILLIMMGAASFSVMFLTVKLMANVNTFTLVFYRSMIQIVISLSTLFQKGISPLGPPDAAVRWQLCARAIWGGLAVAAFFFGIQELPLPDAVTLQFTTPPFAAFFAVLMVGEPWRVLDMVGAVVCLSGVAFIAHPSWLFGDDNGAVEDTDQGPSPFMKTLAVLITTGGAASAGVAYVMVRVIGNRADAIVMVLYYAVMSLPLCYFGSGFIENDWNVWRLHDFATKDYILLLLMGLGGYGGQWFTNLGLQNETAATATLATSTQIVWTYIFELLFLHEPLNVWSLGGTGLILGYMLIVGLFKMMEHPRLPSPPKEETISLMKDIEKQDYQAMKEQS